MISLNDSKDQTFDTLTLITHKTCTDLIAGEVRGHVITQRCPLWALVSYCHQASWLGRATPPAKEQKM